MSENANFTTTDSGAPAGSDEHSLTVGAAGPIVLHDHYLIEKLAHFNRENIPERLPHFSGEEGQLRRAALHLQPHGF